jgi:hypothetical protein
MQEGDQLLAELVWRSGTQDIEVRDLLACGVALP